MKKYLILPTFLLLSFAVFSQKANSESYIIHKVQAKETLYSLVKKYNTNFATVETLNPEFADGKADIKVGQSIKFPKNSPTQTNTVVIAKKTDGTKTAEKTHVVQAKETVFSISKKYNIDISNLVEANNLTNNSIKVGDQLKVDATEIAEIASTSKRGTELVMKRVGRDVKETGLAEVISTPNRANIYLALHRTAPVGSNIKVTNEATGHSIVAKVIANLSQVGPDQNIMVKLSPYAYYQLRPTDTRMRATVEYYLPFTENPVAGK